MTNEALIRLYNENETEEILEKLYHKNEGLILDLAKKVAAAFNCLQYNDNTKQYTEYTGQMLEELKSEGALEFFRLIREGGYHESKARFSTYVYPYLQGVMYRRMEKILDYNNHFQSVHDLVPEDEQGESELIYPYEYLTSQMDTVSVSQIVYHKICLEKLRELFLSLPEKDRYILGHSFGVFGYERKSIDEIAMEEMLTSDGVIKARTAAICKMREMYPESGLYLWRMVYHRVMQESERYHG